MSNTVVVEGSCHSGARGPGEIHWLPLQLADDGLRLADQGQHVLRQTVGLGQHGGAGLDQDLVLG